MINISSLWRQSERGFISSSKYAGLTMWGAGGGLWRELCSPPREPPNCCRNIDFQGVELGLRIQSNMLSALLLVPLLSSTGCSYLFMSPSSPLPPLAPWYQIIQIIISYILSYNTHLAFYAGCEEEFYINSCQINIILIIWGLLTAYC